MDTLITSLINTGGLGILAGVLLYLHLRTMVVFREELKAEREANSAHILEMMSKIDRNYSVMDRNHALLGQLLQKNPCNYPPWKYGPSAPDPPR